MTTSTRPFTTVCLQVKSLKAFIEELKSRGIQEARLCELAQRREVFEYRKLRFTALDYKAGVILRFDLPFYHDFATIHQNENEKYERTREKVQQQIRGRLEQSGIHLREGEYHHGKVEW